MHYYFYSKLLPCLQFFQKITGKVAKVNRDTSLAQDLTTNCVNVKRFEWLYYWYINDRKLEVLMIATFQMHVDLHGKWLLKLFNIYMT
jgi:hypothetical protein